MNRKHTLSRSSSYSPSSTTTHSSSFVPNLISLIMSTKETIKGIVEYVHINKQVLRRNRKSLFRFIYHEAQNSTLMNPLVVSVELSYKLSFLLEMLLKENNKIKQNDLRHRILHLLRGSFVARKTILMMEQHAQYVWMNLKRKSP